MRSSPIIYDGWPYRCSRILIYNLYSNLVVVYIVVQWISILDVPTTCLALLPLHEYRYSIAKDPKSVCHKYIYIQQLIFKLDQHSKCMKLSMLARQLSWEISEMSSRSCVHHSHILSLNYDDMAFTFVLHRCLIVAFILFRFIIALQLI